MINLTGANHLFGGRDGLFDGHAHVFRNDLAMAPGRRYTPDSHALLEDYVTLLRAHGLDGGLLVQPSFLGTDNSFLTDCLERAEAYEDLTLAGVAVVDAGISEGALADLNARGVIGMRFNLLGKEDTFEPADWQTVLKRADALGWHVEIHARGPALPPLLKSLLKTNSCVVVDHFGLPNPFAPLQCDGFRALCRAPREKVMVKVSAPYRVLPGVPFAQAGPATQSLFDRLINRLGADRLMWGSDWPGTQHESSFNYGQTLAWRNGWIATHAGAQAAKVARSVHTV